MPFGGQSHLVKAALKIAVVSQVAQLLNYGPLHILQVGWHNWQVP